MSDPLELLLPLDLFFSLLASLPTCFPQEEGGLSILGRGVRTIPPRSSNGFDATTTGLAGSGKSISKGLPIETGLVPRRIEVELDVLERDEGDRAWLLIEKGNSDAVGEDEEGRGRVWGGELGGVVDGEEVLKGRGGVEGGRKGSWPTREGVCFE